MDRPPPSAARRLPRLTAVAVALTALTALGFAAPAAADPSGSPSAPPSAGTQAPGQQRATFGLRTATATKPDTRPNFSYGATPGGLVKDFVAVDNIGEAPLTLKVYASDALNTPEGGFDLLPAATSPVDVGAWIKIGEPTVTVPPRTTQIVPFSLTVPANAAAGDHTGGIVASLTTERTSANGDKVSVDQRVGARVYLRVAGDLKPMLSIEALHGGYHQPSDPLGKGSATLTYSVRNTGNVRVAGGQRVEVATPWGSTVAGAALPNLTELLPGNTMTVTAQVPGLITAGWLTGKVTVTPTPAAGTSDRPGPVVRASVTFTAVPWVPLVVVAALLLALLVLLWTRHRRRRAPVGGTTADDLITGSTGARDEATEDQTDYAPAR